MLLEQYYSTLGGRRYRQELEERAKRGEPIPQDLDAAQQIFTEQGLVMEDHLVDPHDLANVLKSVAPGAIDEKAARRPAARCRHHQEGLSAVPLLPYGSR